MRSGSGYAADSRKSHPKYFLPAEVATLLAIMRHAGIDIRVGSMLPEMTEGGDRNQARGWEQTHAGTDPPIWLFRGDAFRSYLAMRVLELVFRRSRLTRLEEGTRRAGWGKRAGTVSGYN
jgi:hypothetical protein